MAAGLPVLTTTATAAPDIVTQELDGFVIEPGNLDTLINKMEFCLKNRERIAEMGRAARKTAERFSWDAYGDRWEKILEEHQPRMTRIKRMSSCLCLLTCDL